MDILTALRLQGMFGQSPSQGIISDNGNLPSFQEGGNFPWPNDPSMGTGSGPGANQFIPHQVYDDESDDKTLSYKHTLSDRLADTLSNMPQRPQPGKFRSIAAAIAGFGAGGSPLGIVGGQPIGYKFNPAASDLASHNVKYGNYDNDLNDWSTKVKALVGGAAEEDKANANTRLTNFGIEKQLLDRTKADISQQRANTYQDRVDKENQRKIDESQRKVDDTNAKLEFAKSEATRKQGDFDTQAKLHQAQLDSLNAQRALENAQRDAKLTETTRKNDAYIEELANKDLPREKQLHIQRNAAGEIIGTTTTTKTSDGKTAPDDPGGIRKPQGDDD